jgi:hypothetical protein
MQFRRDSMSRRREADRNASAPAYASAEPPHPCGIARPIDPFGPSAARRADMAAKKKK